jgi:plastocyanin
VDARVCCGIAWAQSPDLVFEILDVKDGSMRKTLYLLCIAGLLMAIVTGRHPILAGGPESKPSTGVEVKIDNFAFTPATLTIPAGAEVTWVNKDEIAHTVVDNGKAFKSKTLNPDEKFSFILATPGTYSYICSIHPMMKGTIVVQ